VRTAYAVDGLDSRRDRAKPRTGDPTS
jgi:hypothetical protein